jgi:hypothetical protein
MDRVVSQNAPSLLKSSAVTAAVYACAGAIYTVDRKLKQSLRFMPCTRTIAYAFGDANVHIHSPKRALTRVGMDTRTHTQSINLIACICMCIHALSKAF